MASKVNSTTAKAGKDLDHSLPETFAKIGHPAAKATATALPVINAALSAGNHRTVGTFLAQEKHRTPDQFLKQKDHRTPFEFLMGAQSKNH
jgi:hypothetical protein